MLSRSFSQPKSAYGLAGASLVLALVFSGCVATAPVRRPAPRRAAAKVETVREPGLSRPAPVETSGDDALPTVLSPLKNLNDFTLLANGGFDPGWRVGYDGAWVVQLPPAPAGDWDSAYLGAKLGRAKWEPIPGRPPWEKRRVKGEIDIAVADEPLWPHSRRHLLARAEDIPMDGDPDNAAEGVGEARWFWVEVPLKFVSFDKPNFIALYSPSESLKGQDRAPVLAAGARSGLLKGVTSWLSASAKGQPPLGPEAAFKSTMNTYAPAVALKLVPKNARSVQVSLAAPAPPSPAAEPFVLPFTVTGTDVQRFWVETSTDSRKWSPMPPVLLGPPYAVTVRPEKLPKGAVWLRGAAADQWENKGVSEPVQVDVPPRKK